MILFEIAYISCRDEGDSSLCMVHRTCVTLFRDPVLEPGLYFCLGL